MQNPRTSFLFRDPTRPRMDQREGGGGVGLEYTSREKGGFFLFILFSFFGFGGRGNLIELKIIIGL